MQFWFYFTSPGTKEHMVVNLDFYLHVHDFLN